MLCILFLVAISLAIVYFFYKRDDGVLNCDSKMDLKINTNDDRVIVGKLNLTFHLVFGGKGYISEQGIILQNNITYHVDRYVRLSLGKRLADGYINIKRDSVDKNENDDLPDSLTKLLTSNQKEFYFKIEDFFRSDIIKISDLRRTVFVCRKK